MARQEVDYGRPYFSTKNYSDIDSSSLHLPLHSGGLASRLFAASNWTDAVRRKLLAKSIYPPTDEPSPC